MWFYPNKINQHHSIHVWHVHLHIYYIWLIFMMNVGTANILYIYTFMVWEQNKIFRGPWIFSVAWLWTNKLGRPARIDGRIQQKWCERLANKDVYPDKHPQYLHQKRNGKKTSWGMTRCLGNSGEPEPLGSSTKISHRGAGEKLQNHYGTIRFPTGGPLLGIRDQKSKKMVV